jgi:hypothetical protein
MEFKNTPPNYHIGSSGIDDIVISIFYNENTKHPPLRLQRGVNGRAFITLKGFAIKEYKTFC